MRKWAAAVVAMLVAGVVLAQPAAVRSFGQEGNPVAFMKKFSGFDFDGD